MKKLLTVLLVLCLLSALAVPVFATETAEPTTVPVDNTCGENMTWEYADGVLTITGSGSMDDFEEEAPWAAYKNEIKRVVLSGSISYIGARAFSNYDALETVNFGSSLYEIGTEAFKSCDGLTIVYLPASFKVFGEGSFMSCSNLTAIHCSGKFPSFRLNCMWDTYGIIYYPADKPWSTTYIEQMETAFKGRIEFLASDGTDHYQPTEATEPVTEVPTEAPTEAPTEIPTEAPTQAPTTAPTMEPETIPVTEPVTQPMTQTPTETIPQVQEEPKSGSWIGLVIIGIIAVFLLVGTIIFSGSRRRGKYSKRRRKG